MCSGARLQTVARPAGRQLLGTACRPASTDGRTHRARVALSVQPPKCGGIRMSCYDCQQYLGCNDSRKHITLCEHYTPKCCGVPMSATNEGGTFTFTCVRCSRVFLLIL